MKEAETRDAAQHPAMHGTAPGREPPGPQESTVLRLRTVVCARVRVRAQCELTWWGRRCALLHQVVGAWRYEVQACRSSGTYIM